MNNKRLLTSVGIFLFILPLYLHVEMKNRIVSAKMELARLEKQLLDLSQIRERLDFENRCQIHPKHLFYLSSQPDFSHLHIPSRDEVVVIPVAICKSTDQPLGVK